MNTDKPTVEEAKKQIEEAIEERLGPEKSATLYRAIRERPFTTIFSKGLGKRRDENRPFEMAEIAAEAILERLNDYSITEIRRERSYYIEDHDRCARESDKLNSRGEKYRARTWFYGRNFPGIGKIIDFETPLRAKDEDNEGEIDLLAYDTGKNPPVLTLLEYKTIENIYESLLRCVLEIYTYSKQVYAKNLKKHFHTSPFNVDENSTVKAAVFVHKDSVPYEHFHKGKDTNIRKLMRKLGVGFISIDDLANRKVTVEEV